MIFVLLIGAAFAACADHGSCYACNSDAECKWCTKGDSAGGPGCIAAADPVTCLLGHADQDLGSCCMYADAHLGGSCDACLATAQNCRWCGGAKNFTDLFSSVGESRCANYDGCGPIPDVDESDYPAYGACPGSVSSGAAASSASGTSPDAATDAERPLVNDDNIGILIPLLALVFALIGVLLYVTAWKFRENTELERDARTASADAVLEDVTISVASVSDVSLRPLYGDEDKTMTVAGTWGRNLGRL